MTYDPADPSWFVVHRAGTAVVVNLAPEAQAVPLPGAERRAVLLAWETTTPADGGVAMPGHSVAVLGRPEPP